MPNYNSNLQTNNTNLQEILDAINELPNVSGGVELPELTNEGAAADLLANKQLIDSDGNVVTGTFTIDEEIYTQEDLITQIQNAINNLPDANSGGSNGVFNLRIFSEERFSNIMNIYYMSNGQSCSWEFDGIAVNEIVIENIDVNSFFVIDAGVFYAGAQDFMYENISTDLVAVAGDAVFYGTQSNIVATIQLWS